jgi:hypothetical protein
MAILVARHSGADAQAQAVSMTLGLHLGAFALSGLLAFVLMPRVYESLGLWGTAAATSLFFIAVTAYIGLHEAGIRYLWRLVQEQ